MRPRFFVLTLFIVASLIAGPATAQTPQPPTGATPIAPGPWPFLDQDGDEHGALPRRSSANTATAGPAVPIGQPGLSFRYAQTFGETGVPYFADTDHLNYPWGIGAAGNAVWIGEHWGGRILKFTSNGSFVSSIGQVGTRDFGGHSISEIHDVVGDSSGNTWLAGSDIVLKFDSSGAVVSRLGRGSGNQQFQYAVSVAFDVAGNIYVSDGTSWWGNSNTGNHRIQIFSSSGTYLSTIGATGVVGTANNRFHGPRHITIYGSTLYVADSGNHRVQLFDVSNPMAPVYVATIGVTDQAGSDNGHLGSPSGVAVNSSFIYVADTWNDRVQIFNQATRAYVATIGGSMGAGNNQFYEPSDVAVDAAGHLYVADFVNTRVQQFDGNRTYVRTYGATGVPYLTDGYHYNYPSGVAAADDGSLYITEDDGHRLIKLDAAGQLEWAVGAAGVKGDWIHTNDRLNNPADVALDAAGRVLVADRWNGRVQIFDADGSYYGTMEQPVSGERGFNCPGGVGVAPNGDIYVVDTCTHVVDIFNRYWLHLATLGTVDQAGTDNAHFDGPEDVAIDSRGFIYVADKNNHRVQVFDVNRGYLRTIGVTDEASGDFGHLAGPDGLFVDGADRLYIADSWNNRIQVFDTNGAYLATIGGSWGARSGQLRNPRGVAIAPTGDVFIADSSNYRIQKFATGVPGWVQTNVNGFGDRNNVVAQPLRAFGGALYAGVYNWNSNDLQLWRMSPAGVWSAVMHNAFGDPSNTWFSDLIEFSGQLYVGTENWVCDNPNCNTRHSTGGQVWRSSNGSTWNQVGLAGFGDPTNFVAIPLAAFGGHLYIGTYNYDAATNTTYGAQVWRSSTGNAGSWTRVVTAGFDGNINNQGVHRGAVHGGYLYLGTVNPVQGAGVWRSADGVTWQQVNVAGFGDIRNYRTSKLATFGGYLYAATDHFSGGGVQVWRCQLCTGSDWTRVVDNGFGNPDTQQSAALVVFDNQLYGAFRNLTTGTEVRRTQDGVHWAEASMPGFGNSNNHWVDLTVFDNRLVAGTNNGAHGSQVWKKTVTADFSGSPLTSSPPLTVNFSNASGGDVTGMLWDFGDGQTSTEDNPTHTYTQAGMYTVSLTVSDGVDNHTLTRPAYVDARYRTFLPLLSLGHGTTVYDSFDNPVYDGSFNPLRWSRSSADPAVQFRQQSGALVVTNTPSANPAPPENLRMRRPPLRRWQQVQQLQARLKVSSDRSGEWSPVQLSTWTEEVNGHGWFASCTLAGMASRDQASFHCHIFTRQGSNYPDEYSTPGVSVPYDSWHTVRISLDPNTANVKFYLNNALIGSHTPNDAAALLTNHQMQVAISVWGSGPNSSATRHVDDVRIVPTE
ncbi:MAG TPA: PKD domain-containing protein [Anaerolineae bacterium]|nr:PKD domain-containing protein [Anaerolineae bacterium]HNU04504.1 PKD domain-containing protein [Anaerolineae bacterium]